jgi:23S rRNA pseudouridine1911/1915/1917 synthase
MSEEIEKSFTTERYIVSYPVLSEHDNLRLDQFIMSCMPTLSRQFLKKKIEKGEVVISGRTPPHKSSVKVHYGERVTITTHNDGAIEDEFWHGEAVPRDQAPTIIFEDQGLLVINKPPFMITHPAGKNLFYCATVWYETIYKHTMHSIHRLDRETSGILMLGKNPKTSQKVSALFEEEKVKKCYFLIAHKNPGCTPFPFTAKERLGRNEDAIPQGMIYAHPENSEEGKDADTHFELVLELEDYVLALAFPHTGRQHQIRVHAASHGYPLLGDKLYNGDSSVFMRFKDHSATEHDHEKMQIPRQALHAVALKLPYPDQKQTHFIAPLPKDLSDWMELKHKISHAEVEKMIEEKVLRFLD